MKKNRISRIQLQPDIRIRLFSQPDNPDLASKSLSGTALEDILIKKLAHVWDFSVLNQRVSHMRKFFPLIIPIRELKLS